MSRAIVLVMLDAHHHVWDVSVRHYPWLAGGQLWATDEELAPLRRSFGVADLAPLAARSGVTATIVVQTCDEPWETTDLFGVALGGSVVPGGTIPGIARGGTIPPDPPGTPEGVHPSAGLIAGVVGWTDLAAPDVAGAVAALTAMPGGSALCGIRHPLLAEPDPDWLSRPAVRRGLRALAGAGLAFDLVVRPDQLASAVAAAREVPALTFVLDHLGGPPVESGQVSGPWADAIRDLGALPNVACKLSGAHSDPLSAAALRPYYEVALDAFGPGRLMFGSDWPVSALAAPYGEVVALYQALTANLTAAERSAIFEGTARHIYRLLLLGP